MRPRLLMVILAAPACLNAGEPGPARPKVARESLALLKESFAYQPPCNAGAVEKKGGGDEVVKMAPFIVVESLRQRELNAKLRRDAQKKKDEQFTPVKGGTILETNRLKIGTWPDPEGYPPGFKFVKIKF